MAKMQSPRLQCCLCACSVFSVLFGVFMLAAGVCLVLNYNFLEVDTSGLPPNLHNEEGKKVVGIILICVGIASMGLGGLVSTLYFTSCGRSTPSPPASVNHKEGHSNGDAASAGKNRLPGQGRPSSHEGHRHHRNGGGRHHHHHHMNGALAPISRGGSPGLSGRRAGSLPNLRMPGAPVPSPLAGGAQPSYTRGGAAALSLGARGNGVAQAVPGARPHGARHGKGKGRHHGRYKNPLPSHQEEEGADGQSMNESRHSASSRKRLQFPSRTGHVNLGATVDDEFTMGGRSNSTVSAPGQSVVIVVDSTHLEEEDASPRQRPLTFPGEAGGYDRQLSEDLSIASAPVYYSPDNDPSNDSTDTLVRDYEEEEEENEDEASGGGGVDEGEGEMENGRMSRSTVDSQDTVTSDGNSDPRVLDDQIRQLVS